MAVLFKLQTVDRRLQRMKPPDFIVRLPRSFQANLHHLKGTSSQWTFFWACLKYQVLQPVMSPWGIFSLRKEITSWNLENLIIIWIEMTPLNAMYMYILQLLNWKFGFCITPCQPLMEYYQRSSYNILLCLWKECLFSLVTTLQQEI